MKILTLMTAPGFWCRMPLGQVGMNSSYHNDWSSQLAFVDLFKQSRSWLPHNAPWDWRDSWESGLYSAQSGRRSSGNWHACCATESTRN